jgi:hypothetical protein
MPNPIQLFPDLDRDFSPCADPEEIVRARTRRLTAKLFRIVRPTLAIHPRRANVYIALDAVAWAAAMILASTEDRDALDFFTLALTQNLDRLEAGNSDGHAADAVPAQASRHNGNPPLTNAMINRSKVSASSARSRSKARITPDGTSTP